MLIRRYLFREIGHTFFAVVLVVLLIAISNKFVRLVGQAAVGDIAPNILWQVILFQIPELLAFLLPVALYLAILLCLSRFFADNEIPVMLACGISWQRLLAVGIGLSVIVMIFAGSLTCYWSPRLAQYREQLLHEEGPMVLVQTVKPGRFHSIQQDRLVFYVADLNVDHTELKQVFIAEQPNDIAGQESQSLITAKAGKVITDPQNGLTYFKLIDGRRYEGTPGEMDFSVLSFKNYQRLLEGSSTPQGYYHRSMPTQMLVQHPTPANLAELQWRISIPLAAPILALLAVPLSRVSPRSGRFGKLFIAVVLCIIYFNLLTISKRWILSGVLSPSIGVWWVHLLFLIVGLGLLAKTSGRWQQGYYALKQGWLRRGKRHE